MVRGRIDAMLLTPQQIEIIDYKTDRVAPEKIAERAAFYQPQVALYRRAIQQITGRAVQTVRLVFLFARVVVDC
jgi:ATP-dependent helicase/nuclease subunit A